MYAPTETESQAIDLQIEAAEEQQIFTVGYSYHKTDSYPATAHGLKTTDNHNDLSKICSIITAIAHGPYDIYAGQAVKAVTSRTRTPDNLSVDPFYISDSIYNALTREMVQLGDLNHMPTELSYGQIDTTVDNEGNITANIRMVGDTRIICISEKSITEYRPNDMTQRTSYKSQSEPNTTSVNLNNGDRLMILVGTGEIDISYLLENINRSTNPQDFSDLVRDYLIPQRSQTDFRVVTCDLN